MRPLCRTLLLSVFAAGLLSACGGGGSGDGNSGNPIASSTAPSQAPVAPSTTATASSDGGRDASAPVSVANVASDGRNWINYRRGQIGLSQLTENALVDRAAQSHSDYQRLNNTISHSEDAKAQGYTGASLDTRLATAGLKLNPNNFAYGEVIAAMSNGSGFSMAEQLITAIYHRFVIFEPVFKDIGTGAGNTVGNFTYFTADFLANNGYGPGLGRGRLATWPFDGQTGVQANFFSDQEEPDPIDNANEVGYPVSVQGDINAVLSVNSFTITPRNGASLAAKLLQHATDPKTPASAAAIIPLSKLAAATTYDVTFKGSADGVPLSLNWSFTTK